MLVRSTTIGGFYASLYRTARSIASWQNKDKRFVQLRLRHIGWRISTCFWQMLSNDCLTEGVHYEAGEIPSCKAPPAMNSSPQQQPNTRLIIADGLSGSGKSTFCQWLELQLLSNKIKARWVFEADVPHPLHWWNYWDGSIY